MATTEKSTVADLIVRRLGEYGVRSIFGYPGGQITPLYDALARQSQIRHILARDEQGAAFMADGHARATGQPGVCLAVCGPGVLNAATPLATSFTDSIPVLLLSGQVMAAGRGLRSGYYHENDQLAACATFTKWRARIDQADQIVTQLDTAFGQLMNDRPGPVFLEIPVDVLRAEIETATLAPLPAPMTIPTPSFPQAKELVDLVQGWKRPAFLAGGGVITACAEGLLTQVAERLGAPVFHSLMGKCAIPSDHPLAFGLPWNRATSDLSNMSSCFSPLLREADGLLAVGCRFTQATTGSWTMPIPSSVAQIDVDPEELGRHFPIKLGVHGDAREVLLRLLRALPEKRRPWATPPTALPPWRLPKLELLSAMRRGLPRDAIVVADITRLSYIMLSDFPVYLPRTFLHPAGFVPMGYGIPAAIGAKSALPDRTVAAVIGDGCFLMSAMELATAVQESLPIVVILLNDNCLTLIKAIQQRRYESRYLGVDLKNPDFGMLAQSFGVRHWRVDSDSAFELALNQAVKSRETSLIEVMVPGISN